MAYRCDKAVTGSAREPIRCKVSGTVCAHQKMCMMEGRIVLTDGAMRCPARDGKLPGEIQERTAVAARTMTRRTAVRKTATGKTEADAAKKQRAGAAKGKASGKTAPESAAKKQRVRKA